MTSPQMIFLNLPITSAARSRAFYAGLGFTFNEQFCSEDTLCCVISDTIFLMLMERDRFAGFSPSPVGDAQKDTSHLICLSRESRAAVDAMVEAAVAHGGRDNDKPQDLGFLYSRSFSDPDGHVFEPAFMDLSAAQQAFEGAEQTSD